MSMDAFLVQQTLDGDDKAFGQLVQKYQSSVYKICLAIVKNPQDAEELGCFCLRVSKTRSTRRA
ncbi:MAG: RNA polymerase sigma factor [Candidatus Poribacteria bacterium]